MLPKNKNQQADVRPQFSSVVGDYESEKSSIIYDYITTVENLKNTGRKILEKSASKKDSDAADNLLNEV